MKFDPGERVAADTLSELWPMVLQRAMRFGQIMPTQYGNTRELLCLVGVVRDVEKSLGELTPYPTFPMDGLPEDAPDPALHNECSVCGAEVNSPCVDEESGKPVRAFHAARVFNTQAGEPIYAQRSGGSEDEPEFIAFTETDKHPILGISWAQAEAYRDQVAGLVPPTDRPYSYGSRMRGRDLPHKPYRVGSGRQRESPDYKVIYEEDCCERTPSCIRSRGHGGSCDREEWWENEKNLKVLALENDQIHKVEQLLSTTPGTRAAYLTPWRPAEDAGKESGRPCMVGAWFRVSPSPGILSASPGDWYVVQNEDGNYERWRLIDGSWGREATGDDKGVEIPLGGRSGTKIDPRNILHLVVAFRSHDLFGAYPTNLAGIMLWQSETAKKLGMQVGTLTVTSYSAHVYARDWAVAEAVVEAHLPKGPFWDQRSTWRVEQIEVSQPWPEIGSEVTYVHERPWGSAVGTWRIEQYQYREGEQDPWDVTLVPAEVRYTNMEPIIRLSTTDLIGIRPRQKFMLRATALTPDGKDVIQVFEAETAEGLRGMIERSGLVTSIGAAMWLGDEIRRKA